VAGKCRRSNSDRDGGGLSAERRGHKKQVEEREQRRGSGWGRRRGKGDDVEVDLYFVRLNIVLQSIYEGDKQLADSTYHNVFNTPKDSICWIRVFVCSKEISCKKSCMKE
jgi:hypothetical protein